MFAHGWCAGVRASRASCYSCSSAAGPPPAGLRCDLTPHAFAVFQRCRRLSLNRSFKETKSSTRLSSHNATWQSVASRAQQPRGVRAAVAGHLPGGARRPAAQAARLLARPQPRPGAPTRQTCHPGRPPRARAQNDPRRPPKLLLSMQLLLQSQPC